MEENNNKESVVCDSIVLKHWYAHIRIGEGIESEVRITNAVIEDGRFIAYGDDGKVYSCRSENSIIE